MAELVAYVKGPLTVEKGFFGKRKVTVYHMNPQVYLDANPSPVRNFGVFEYEFEREPHKTELESRMQQDLKEVLGTGIDIGRIILPSEKINITFEYVSD